MRQYAPTLEIWRAVGPPPRNVDIVGRRSHEDPRGWRARSLIPIELAAAHPPWGVGWGPGQGSDKGSIGSADGGLQDRSGYMYPWGGETQLTITWPPTCWIPGHTNIAGNEQADALAKAATSLPEPADALPTLAHLRRTARQQSRDAFEAWWDASAPDQYKPLHLKPTTSCPPELELPRPLLHHLLAARSRHGDFADYHERFNHDDARLSCSCGRRKEPSHLFYCRKILPRHRMRLAPSPTAAVNRAIGRDFDNRHAVLPCNEPSPSRNAGLIGLQRVTRSRFARVLSDAKSSIARFSSAAAPAGDAMSSAYGPSYPANLDSERAAALSREGATTTVTEWQTPPQV
ncbi:hypothetical protein PCL_10699 [Purpureocillium lilacinum]|uniref:RNase H type-1 domain-containing protein n=1 Tax=Purpureocillium lilacinum TaxID=33203 RepID=A0A2U3EC41_PURLI|nr:hypothetical protein PCL_10699 [Purpureocillium lilacinum]